MADGLYSNRSRQLLQRLGSEGRVIALFHNIGGNFVRNGYEFLYSRIDYVGNIPDSAQAIQMVAESKTEEDEQQIYMMDANEFDMRDVAAAVAELNELPDWVGGDIEEYFPRESMEVNETGEIIITLKHGDSKVLITPDHSLYARLKAIVDSGASVCSLATSRILTAGTPIMAEGYGTVGKLQNCLLVKDLQKNLISVPHVCRDMITDNVRCVCLEKGSNTIIH
jgi:hypothetical protein